MRTVCPHEIRVSLIEVEDSVDEIERHAIEMEDVISSMISIETITSLIALIYDTLMRLIFLASLTASMRSMRGTEIDDSVDEIERHASGRSHRYDVIA